MDVRRKNCVRYFIICLLVLMPKGVLCQQKNDSIPIEVKVYNSFTREKMDSVTLKLFDANGVLLATELMRTRAKISEGVVIDIVPNLKMKLMPGNSYRLCASQKGFVEVCKDFEVPVKLYGRNVDKWELEMELDKDLMLDAVDVVASKVKMVMNGDTLVYNADAFKLAEGSMLDKLIEQLPGVTLSDGGQIKVNGQFVSSLLINGKDFFKGNPTAALQNLPAYVVKNVKVYNKAKDDAYLYERSDEERKSDPLVMDVNLKKEFMGTVLGNFDAGYGSRDRYMAKGFLSRFDDKLSTAVYASVNNAGFRDGFSRDRSRSVVWDASSLSTNDATYRQAGLSVDYDDKITRRSAGFTLEGCSNSQNNRSESTTLNYMPYSASYSLLSQDRRRDSYGWLRLDASTSMSFSRLHWIAELNGYIGRNKAMAYKRSGQLYGFGWQISDLDTLTVRERDFINLYKSVERVKSDNWNARLGHLITYKLPFTGDVINLSVIGYHSDSRNKNMLSNMLVSRSDNDVRNDYYAMPSRSTNVKATLTYDYNLNKRVKITPSYAFVYTDYRNDRDLYHFGGDSLMSVLPSLTDSISMSIDLRQSYVNRTQTRTHRAGLKVRYTLDRLSVTANLPVSIVDKDMLDTRAYSGLKQKRSFTAFEPSVNCHIMTGGHNFYVNYNMTVNSPNANQVLDYTDDTNLLMIKKGNPDLRNSITHSASVSFYQVRFSNSQIINATLSYNKTLHAIANGRTFDALTGVTQIKPMNIEGNWNTELTGSYESNFGKLQRFKVKTTVNGLIADNADYQSLTISDGNQSHNLVRSIVTNYGASCTAELTYNVDKLRVGVRGGIRGIWAESNLDSFESVHGVDSHVGPVVSWGLPYGFYVENTLMLYCRTGYTDRSMNRNSLIWNGAVAKSFGKSNAWTLRVDGVDILGELRNLSRVVNAQGVTETWRNSIGRFVLAHLQYRFSISKKTKQQ